MAVVPETALFEARAFAICSLKAADDFRAVIIRSELFRTGFSIEAILPSHPLPSVSCEPVSSCTLSEACETFFLMTLREVLGFNGREANTLVAGAPTFFSGLGLLMSGIDEKVSLEGELRDGRALVLRIVGDHAVWPSGVPSMVGRADL